MASDHSSTPNMQQGSTKRRQQDLAGMATTHFAASSWGERLLPVMFALLEACWISALFLALASLHFLQMNEPLLPIWAPFVLMGGISWLAISRELHTATKSLHNEDRRSNAMSLYLFVAGSILLIIWASIYSSSTPIFNPVWLLNILDDFFLLTPAAYHIMGIVLLSVYFYWRSIHIAQQTIEPSTVYRTILLGLGIIIGVSIIRALTAAQSSYDLQVLLLFSVFLTLALFTHALAHAAFLRNTHPAGLQGGIHSQEQALLLVITTLCAGLIILGLTIGLLTNPTMLAETQKALSPLGWAYDWLINILAYILALLASPIFWLLNALHFHTSNLPVHLFTPPKQAPHPGSKQTPATTPDSVLTAIDILKVMIPLLFVALVVYLIWRFVRRRRRIVMERVDENIHESLWSWELFLTQLRVFLRAWWQRLFQKKFDNQATESYLLDTTGEPVARSIRELYRAFLKWCAEHGYARMQNETPSEFKQRLATQLPQIEPEVQTLTSAYASLRYGDVVPDEAELARLQQNWLSMQQKRPL